MKESNRQQRPWASTVIYVQPGKVEAGMPSWKCKHGLVRHNHDPEGKSSYCSLCAAPNLDKEGEVNAD